MPPEPITVTVTEAKRVTGLGNTTIYVLLGNGRLKSTKVGTRRLIYMDSIRELLGATS